MNTLQTELKRRLGEKNISISALERDALLKKGTLYNIVYGRSKNPRIDIMQSVAKQLDCTVLELYGMKNDAAQAPTGTPVAEIKIPAVEKQQAVTMDGISKIEEWNYTLYTECLRLVQENCQRRNFATDKRTMLRFIEEIYDYSVNCGAGAIDVMYGEWILRRNLFKEV